MTTLVVMSDTHMRHETLHVPDGDILIHCGDATNRGTPDELHRFARWFRELPHEKKVLIGGNHDVALERSPDLAEQLFGGWCHYLRDEGRRIAGLDFYGMPWTPTFGSWSFMHDPGSPAMVARCNAIPQFVDVLVTHGPAAHILDRGGAHMAHLGCAALRRRLEEAPPRAHLHGHIHESSGLYLDRWLTVNAACRVDVVEIEA